MYSEVPAITKNRTLNKTGDLLLKNISINPIIIPKKAHMIPAAT